MRARKRHDAAVAQADGFFRFGGVGLLANGDELIAFDNEAPITGRIGRAKAQHDNGRTGRERRAKLV